MTTDERRSRTLESLQPWIERARSFSGWSFEGIDRRQLDPPAPWDYERIAREHAAQAGALLDLGTGGGEVLSRIADGFEGSRVVATEEWHVNAPIARDRLAPIAADVVRTQSLRLPFAGHSFDLVLSRHEELDPAEVMRVLRPGGRLITQQIDAGYWREQRPFIPRTVWPEHYVIYADAFCTAGWEVRGRRHEQRVAFPDLGPIVFMLLITPWEAPDFDVERDLDALLAMEDALRTDDGIVLTHATYLLVAESPR
jgi:SAM-dependent methyltransferase